MAANSAGISTNCAFLFETNCGCTFWGDKMEPKSGATNRRQFVAPLVGSIYGPICGSIFGSGFVWFTYGLLS